MTAELIHKMYNPMANVLEAFRARCAGKGIDFDRFTWSGPEVSPFEFTRDPRDVVVLDATLGNLQKTFDFAYDWAAEGQSGGGRRDRNVLTDARHLRLLKGSDPFLPCTLRWRRVRLDVNVCMSPALLRNPRESPGVAGLFLAAEHPRRIAKTDYNNRFGYWLPGLDCTAHNEDTWQSIPCVNFRRSDRELWLDADRRDRPNPFLAVPTFWEN